MANVVVHFVGDTSSLDRSMASMQTSGSRLKGAIKGIAAGLLGLGAIDFAAKAVKGAEDLEAATGRVERTFGPAAKSMEAFAETGVKSFAQTTTAMDDMTNRLGTLLTGLGFGQQQAAGMTKELVTLAGNLAAARHIPMSDAVEALAKGLVGAQRGVKQFGIDLSPAAVNLEAYRSGIATLGAKLTPAQAAQARFNLIMQVAPKYVGAMGDYLKTTAGKTDQFKAAMSETKDQLGAALLPAINQVLQALTPMIKTFTDFIKNNKGLTQAILATAAALVVLDAALDANPIILIIGGLAALAIVVGIVTSKFGILAGALTLFAVLAFPLTVGLALLAGAVYLVYRNLSTLESAFHTVVGVLGEVAAWIGTQWLKIMQPLIQPFLTLWSVVSVVFNAVVSVISTVIGWIAKAWSTVSSILTIPLRIAWAVISTIFQAIIGAAQAVYHAVTGWFGAIGNFLGGLGKTWGAFVAGLVGVLHLVGRGAQDAYTAVVRWFGAIAGAISDAAGAVGRAAQSVADAFLNPLKSAFDWAKSHVPGFSLVTGASGGIVTRPTFALIGEAGPEAVVPLSGTPGSRSLGGGGGLLGGNTYNIDVHVAPGTDPSRVGAALVQSIQAYEHANGAGWRGAA
jgi:phage-related protein